MMNILNSAKVDFLSKAENLGFARVSATSFAAFLDFTLDELEDIKLTVSEAVSNCIIHSYSDGTGSVEMDMKVFDENDGRYLQITITDTGIGIADLDEARRPGYSSDPEHMGMGLTMMEALSDSMEIISDRENGTKVTMKFSHKDSNQDEIGG